jgi:hypothetical protein
MLVGTGACSCGRHITEAEGLNPDDPAGVAAKDLVR